MAALQDRGPVVAAEALLFGLTADQQNQAAGEWTIDLLADDGPFWKAPSLLSLSAGLRQAPSGRAWRPADLGAGQVLRLPWIPTRSSCSRACVAQSIRWALSPARADADGSLFGFDGGIGSGSLGNAPRLLLSTGPLVAHAHPHRGSPLTPTPGSVLTAAIKAMQQATDVAPSTARPPRRRSTGSSSRRPATRRPCTSGSTAEGIPLPVFTPVAPRPTRPRPIRVISWPPPWPSPPARPPRCPSAT